MPWRSTINIERVLIAILLPHVAKAPRGSPSMAVTRSDNNFFDFVFCMAFMCYLSLLIINPRGRDVNTKQHPWAETVQLVEPSLQTNPNLRTPTGAD